MKIEKNLLNEEIVIIENEDGTTWSGLKSIYDEQQANQAQQPEGNN